ncbi:MFS general substrate transporter [Teratosphaeria nubilosa]|uniref:MFS general substrate transporter n=1 Tax=Teratosphaeria nubilosa TaxID=161662 RepID=A0A6G1LCZ8_9PEZI|nr:MFS general substrate transporter [Teratosphaeria nubilosa]
MGLSLLLYGPLASIFWLQTALGGCTSILVSFLIPETIHYKRSNELSGLTKKQKAKKLWEWTNPWRVVVLFRYPNILVAGLASGALMWNQYSLLTPVRYVLNPRFGLTSPLQSGLLYIAPGFGYVTGPFFGGRWADRVVRKWINKRNGQRIPEGRLNSTLIAISVMMPGCMLVYGWCIDKKVGGIPVPILAMFLQGVGQTICFSSLTTYCLDVMKFCSSEVVAVNYVIRYAFAAAGSAACLPRINKIGVGWFSTISALFLVLAAVANQFNAKLGARGREWIDDRNDERK